MGVSEVSFICFFVNEKENNVQGNICFVTLSNNDCFIFKVLENVYSPYPTVCVYTSIVGDA